MSVWDTYGMKTEIVLAKSWIQTPKEGYGNRSDELLAFLLEGGRVYNFVFFGARSDFSQKSWCSDNFFTKWVAARPRGLIFNMAGPIFRARLIPSVKKMSRPQF